MQLKSTSSHGARVRAALAASVVALGSLTAVGAATVTATPAAAAGKVVTYSATSIRPGALPQFYGATANSDGWALAMSSTQIFNVTHHQPDLEITCHNQSNGATCWPQDQTKIVTHNTFNYATSVGAGAYLDQTSGHLFTYAVQTDGTAAHNQAGVVCIDTTKSATATGSALFCGFTPLSAQGDAPIVTGLFASISTPVQVGTNWYAFNEAAGSGPGGGAGGTENTLMCFNLVTLAACSTPRFTVPLNGAVTGFFGTAPPIGASGTDIFVPVNAIVASVATAEMGCFDTSTLAGCTGTWPVTLPSLAGAPFPMLNSGGTPTGTCIPIAGNPCFTFTGTSAAPPANMAATIGLTSTANGPAVVIGASVYVPNFTTIAVDCYDYATSSSCVHFPKKLFNLAELYTVNRDQFRPNCIWVNSDHGGAQIQNFDATTGGACTPGPIRLQANTVIDPTPSCTPSASQPVTYRTLQITSPPHSSYTSATVQFANPQGTIQSVPAAQSINAFGSVDLSHLNFSGDLLPQFVITLNGLHGTPTTVSLKLTWDASYALDCLREGQTVSNKPGYWMVASDGGIFAFGNAGFFGSTGNLHLNKPIVGISVSPTRGGYWMVASDGGIFAFGSAGFFGSTGNLHLNQPIVGMANTPDAKGYWLVARDGGIFAFGDAHFYGSAGNLTLNKPIVGMAVTPDGGGYWLVASDGGVFSYGDAQFYGSTGNIHLNKPIVAMTANPNGGGYWMVASDGGIFAFGNAGFFGSAGNLILNKPIVGMTPTYNGAGYWLVASDGGIFSYGNALFAGSTGNLTLNQPIVGITA